MNKEELVYALALQDAKGIGCVRAKKLIEAYGSAKGLYKGCLSGVSKANIDVRILSKLFSENAITKAKNEVNKALDKGLKIIYYKNPDYPKYLKNCVDGPLILFQDGGAVVNQYSKIISIVGTRNVTNYGIGFCKELLLSLKKYEPLIVSGYAFGVDICAHLEAVKNDLPTMAVLAHGYGTVYPKEHKKYYEKVKESGGFLSEFTYEEPPYKKNFLKRNRIVAGISSATIIVESAQKGGSLVTADIANSYHKDVFAVPGRIDDVYSKGCNNLIKNHKASLITSGDDLVKQLGWEHQNETKPTKIVQPQLFVNVAGDEKIVYDLLGEKPLYVDAIARASTLPIYKVSNAVFQLEMKGLVKVMPGKLIQLI